MPAMIGLVKVVKGDGLKGTEGLNIPSSPLTGGRGYVQRFNFTQNLIRYTCFSWQNI